MDNPTRSAQNSERIPIPALLASLAAKVIRLPDGRGGVTADGLLYLTIGSETTWISPLIGVTPGGKVYIGLRWAEGDKSPWQKPADERETRELLAGWFRAIKSLEPVGN